MGSMNENYINETKIEYFNTHLHCFHGIDNFELLEKLNEKGARENLTHSLFWYKIEDKFRKMFLEDNKKVISLAIAESCIVGDLTTIKKIVESNKINDYVKRIGIFTAVKFYKPYILEYFLEKKWDINLISYHGHNLITYLLHFWLKSWRTKDTLETKDDLIMTLKLLIENNVDINFISPYNGFNSLHYIILSKGYYDNYILDFLLKNNANPNLLDIESNISPLYLSLSQKKYDYARKLIDYGANPQLQEKYAKNTAIHCTLNKNKPDISIDLLIKLIQKIEDINITNKFGETILHIIARKIKDKSIIETLELVLKLGGNIDIKTTAKRKIKGKIYPESSNVKDYAKIYDNNIILNALESIADLKNKNKESLL